ncbi:hypothetical protein CLOP_g8666 [Closterium sp. NIES-67]|nr:hypothetical protein CLOP_g13536 [Closterium sp. NIES-67]GJP78350.1 hypothetical protein CLOP_g8666 [Closterium sp. NIES-67]
MNEFTGPISWSVGNCTKLNELNLRGNRLSGTIPNTIGNLHALTYLSLAYNQLSGSLPNRLTQLRIGLSINPTRPDPTRLCLTRGGNSWIS